MSCRIARVRANATLVRERLGTGANQLASVAVANPPQDSPSFNPPALRADGRMVAFDSSAENLVAGADEFFDDDVFVRTFTPTLAPGLTVEDFGIVTVGESVQRTITFSHRGFGPLQTSTVSLPASPEFSIVTNGCADRLLHQGGFCQVVVEFHPSEVGSHEGSLRVSHDGLASPATVSLIGDALPVGFGVVELVSRRSIDDPDDPDGQIDRRSIFPDISADGRWVVFATTGAVDPLDAENDDESGDFDIYARDLETDETVLLTTRSIPDAGGWNEQPSVDLFRRPLRRVRDDRPQLARWWG